MNIISDVYMDSADNTLTHAASPSIIPFAPFNFDRDYYNLEPGG